MQQLGRVQRTSFCCLSPIFWLLFLPFLLQCFLSHVCNSLLLIKNFMHVYKYVLINPFLFPLSSLGILGYVWNELQELSRAASWKRKKEKQTKTDSPSLGIHQWPIAPKLVGELYQTCPHPCWDWLVCSRVNLMHAITTTGSSECAMALSHWHILFFRFLRSFQKPL